MTLPVSMRRLANQGGQMTIEMILLMTISVSIAVAVSNSLRENQVVAGLVEGPWLIVQGMIEDGVWQPAGASKVNHPSKKERHRSFEADEIPSDG